MVISACFSISRSYYNMSAKRLHLSSNLSAAASSYNYSFQPEPLQLQPKKLQPKQTHPKYTITNKKLKFENKQMQIQLPLYSHFMNIVVNHATKLYQGMHRMHIKLFIRLTSVA